MPTMVMYSDDIYHSGIKGMKWGQRRYQNEDGSLTPAGRERYRRMYGVSTQEEVDSLRARHAQYRNDIRSAGSRSERRAARKSYIEDSKYKERHHVRAKARLKRIGKAAALTAAGTAGALAAGYAINKMRKKNNGVYVPDDTQDIRRPGLGWENDAPDNRAARERVENSRGPRKVDHWEPKRSVEDRMSSMLKSNASRAAADRRRQAASQADAIEASVNRSRSIQSRMASMRSSNRNRALNNRGAEAEAASRRNRYGAVELQSSHGSKHRGVKKSKRARRYYTSGSGQN